MNENSPSKPLVFACSGCSFAGNLADDLARHMDRTGHAEMSCLAGIGARRPGFLAKLHHRDVWVIDGCAIECARGVFEQAGRAGSISQHIRLHDPATRKHCGTDGGFDIDALARQASLTHKG